MTEPTADDADYAEQHMPAPESEDDDGAIEPGEVNPADAAEQSYDVIDPDLIDDEDHPYDVPE